MSKLLPLSIIIIMLVSSKDSENVHIWTQRPENMSSGASFNRWWNVSWDSKVQIGIYYNQLDKRSSTFAIKTLHECKGVLNFAGSIGIVSKALRTTAYGQIRADHTRFACHVCCSLVLDFD